MKARAVPYALGFLAMTLLALIVWVFFLGRLLPLSGGPVSLLTSLPLILLGGYVAASLGPCLGLGEDESLTVGVVVSVVAFIGVIVLLM